MNEVIAGENRAVPCMLRSGIKLPYNCLMLFCNIVSCQLSESPAVVLPCPPAETAEINQYDLADALIDTEKSQREESLDPGTEEFVSLNI